MEKTERGASIVSLVFAMCLCLGAHFGFVCDARELCVKTDSLGALLDGLAFPECVDHFVLAGFAPGILTATAALLACLETRRHCTACAARSEGQRGAWCRCAGESARESGIPLLITPSPAA